jgi:hypothetical protein
MVTCCEPGHSDRQTLVWDADYGWEDSPGDWHKLVQNPNAAAFIAQRKTTRTITETTEETVAVKVDPDYDPWAESYGG